MIVLGLTEAVHGLGRTPPVPARLAEVAEGWLGDCPAWRSARWRAAETDSAPATGACRLQAAARRAQETDVAGASGGWCSRWRAA
ncbi:hypothetical protein HS99_0027490 [Kitasatospora aureofaciens]|uniref:Uncharacterized protein n=1 Tax=Kitasatospora aureofaciens TaxID=1894 RepID=A0A1E7N7V7_KITAU|nr:hypothetical protein HS99_0027490 [Kitasatospora aureofaciens]QEU98130.1 hypothetical protein CP971_01170 [Streptomyces viridifaciens]GGU69898.1 hypothetical protein GCM10010502_21560 [Kitasatospora aureofaciens]